MATSKDQKNYTLEDYLETFERGTAHLVATTETLQVRWDMAEIAVLTELDPRRLHNLYIRNLFTCYVAKFADLTSSILDSVKRGSFLTYALCGRSMIEHVAALRYFVIDKYKPLLDKGVLTTDEMKELIRLDDQHLRGGRFDWEAFLRRDYPKLYDAAVKELGTKSAKGSKPLFSQDEGTPRAINISTCIEKWSVASPGVKVLYDLFCDMVHPNIGSTFLVASTAADGIYFTKNRGTSVGREIFEQSFPLLVSATQKPFGEFIVLMMGSIWADEDLR